MFYICVQINASESESESIFFIQEPTGAIINTGSTKDYREPRKLTLFL